MPKLRWFSFSLLAASLVAMGLAASVQAATITTPLSSTHGASITGSLTIDDGIDPGNLVITATLDVARGDVRGVLAHVADESLLDGLSVVDARRRAVRFAEDRVGKALKSRGLGRVGSSCPCDFGIVFPAKTGTTISFTLTHESQALTIALFYGQDFAVQASGIRLDEPASRGRGKSRGVQHALLEGQAPTPIPEPTTALLMGLGLGGLSLAGAGRRRS